MVLAPNLEVFKALLADQDVPPSQLDPEWVERLGTK
jgi:hypothetical protein